MSDLIKMEGNVPYPDWCFLDKRDSAVPASWGLRTHELIHGDYVITRRQLDRATKALLSPGYMGNRAHKLIHGMSYPRLKQALIDRYRSVDIPDWEIPHGLWPSGVAPAPPTDGSFGHSAVPTKPIHARYSMLSTLGKEDDSYLEHYGIKGMKWGIRKDRSGGRKKRAAASTMSDTELRETVKRMNLEQNYRQLVSKENASNQTTISRGKGAVQKALKDAGQETMKNLFAKGMGLGVDIAINQVATQPATKEYADVLTKLAGKDKKK